MTTPLAFVSSSHPALGTHLGQRRQLCVHGRRRNNVPANLNRRLIVHCAAKGGKKKKPLPKANKDDVSFSSMAAGPGSAPGKEKPKSLSARLGSKKRTPKSQSKVEKKTMEDFIAEGITDDVPENDASVEDFAAVASSLTLENNAPGLDVQDIRFGVGDVADPFLEEAERSNVARAKASEQQDELSIGKAQDVTGDGGVLKSIVNVGSGEIVQAGASVTVQYSGALADGTVFDSTGDDGFTFVLGSGSVIKGWEAGVATMKVGEKAEFTISPRYAYGRRGMPPTIPGNATLTFTIEITSASGGSEKEVKSVAELNPSISRTPEDIARDYEQLLETQEERKSKMSLFDRFYIISPFASQTGERPPWWLNPRITFFLVFGLVGVGFYFVFIAGAIHQGIPDEVPIDVNIFK